MGNKHKGKKGLPQAAPQELAEKAMSMKDVVEALAKITDRPEDFWVNGIALISKMEQGVAYMIEPVQKGPKFLTCPNCERRFVQEDWEPEPEVESEGVTEDESEEE